MESRSCTFVTEDATDGVRDLAPVADLLSAYLPRPVALLARSLPVERLAGSERRFPAAALVTDIAGFTPLAEAALKKSLRTLVPVYSLCFSERATIVFWLSTMLTAQWLGICVLRMISANCLVGMAVDDLSREVTCKNQAGQ